ncbi:SET domain-containing protein [Hypoxylon sp. FL1150]|nr:SET domain-containing protein [Hypoxylon sp. FL1150]
MGIDAGFDMVPPLSKGEEDAKNWANFLHCVRSCYVDDPKVEAKSHWIEFKAGEHPTLPYEGHKFRRFSSKISGSIASSTGVWEYISTVTGMAKVIFGPRAQPWNEAVDQSGFYGWDEVQRVKKTWGKPDEPESQASISVAAEPASQVSTSPTSDLFEVQQVPGKGRSLVALCDIAKGTRILCEGPLFTVNNMPSAELDKVLVPKIKALSKEQQRVFLSLHNNFPGKHAFAGIVKTNALPCGCNSVTGGIYPTICLINHSCHPNAHNNWNEELEVETIHAIRPIMAGEEITIDYSEGGPSQVRQLHLRKAFGFDCQCTACTLPQQQLKSSDARRFEIQRLDGSIGDPMRMMSRPGTSLADCRSLLQVLEEEYGEAAVSSTARLYYDAFQISVAHSDRPRASVFAERAYRARVICEGEDSPLTQRMKRCMDNPASHKSFGCYSKKWKGSDKFSPFSLGGDELEAWLWRRAT